MSNMKIFMFKPGTEYLLSKAGYSLDIIKKEKTLVAVARGDCIHFPSSFTEWFRSKYDIPEHQMQEFMEMWIDDSEFKYD